MSRIEPRCRLCRTCRRCSSGLWIECSSRFLGRAPNLAGVLARDAVRFVTLSAPGIQPVFRLPVLSELIAMLVRAALGAVFKIRDPHAYRCSCHVACRPYSATQRLAVE